MERILDKNSIFIGFKYSTSIPTEYFLNRAHSGGGERAVHIIDRVHDPM
jgi:hypothetical protein